MTTEIHPSTEIDQSAWVDDLRPPSRFWYLILLLPIVAVMGFAIFQPIQVLPRIGVAPAYALIDQDGQRVTSEEMRGGLTLYTFAHSGCVAPCVPTTATLALLQPALAQVEREGIPLRLVTIFVDPEQATSPRLQALAQSVVPAATAESAGIATNIEWRFLTGDAAQLKNLIGAGFRTYYAEEASGSYTVDPVFVLVDGLGIVRATYRTATPDPALLQRDLGLILQEARNSTGVSRYAYEAAHLFMCYPK